MQDGAFGSYMLDFLNETSSLYTSESEIVFLFIDINEFSLPFEELVDAIDFFSAKTNKTLIINSVSFTPDYLDSFLNETLKKELTYNLQLLELVEKHSNLFLLDFMSCVSTEMF